MDPSSGMVILGISFWLNNSEVCSGSWTFSSIKGAIREYQTQLINQTVVIRVKKMKLSLARDSTVSQYSVMEESLFRRHYLHYSKLYPP